MTAAIIEFPGATFLDLEPERVLDGAKDRLESVLVIGFDKDGQLYMAGSESDAGAMLLLLELAKARLMRMASETLDPLA
jgi:hypothetical protein